MKTQIQLPDFSLLRSNVMNWLKSMRISENGFEYKFSSSTGSSLFTSCFALFILDLFRETDNFSEKEKSGWADYINSFQREEDGLYYPKQLYHPDKERDLFQVTCFCLSALSILESQPTYRLAVADNWRTGSSTEEYLRNRGCHMGRPGSGNKAMFQAIILTHEFERSGDKVWLESINAWFDFHDRHQNKHGFWGKNGAGQLYNGLQNAFHQFVIYEYWNRKYPQIEKVVQTVDKLQEQGGFFSHLPGGDSCKDYDSLHFLISFYYNRNLEKIPETIEKAIGAILSKWNSDGGFCENSFRPYKISDYRRLISFVTGGKSMDISYVRGKGVLKELIKTRKNNTRKWIKEVQPWGESTLWDTWFRCLALGEIAHFYNNRQPFRFQKSIGLGYGKTRNSAAHTGISENIPDSGSTEHSQV